MLAARGRTSSSGWRELLTLHSLSWLLCANLLGLLLATLLLFPRLGEWLTPITYGRLVPLHLNLHLYGWCSLPLLGLLMRFLLPAKGHATLPRLAVGVWSASLLLGASSWLAGHSSGKIFLEWQGAARWGLLANLIFLWWVLALAQGRPQRFGEHPGWRPAVTRWGLLSILLAIPIALFATTDPRTYPPINPASGGPTGASLLGSTLGLVVLLGLCPDFLGLRARGEKHSATPLVLALGLHLGLFLLLGHGDHSHHSDHSHREPAQILALASVGIWIPLLWLHLRKFEWPAAGRPWLLAFVAWGVLLYASGLSSFLPGVLDRFKFTNALVAHAHVAMAGMVSCLNMVFLIGLDHAGRFRRVLADRRAFRLWQAGNLLMFAALMALGLLEGSRPTMLFRPDLAANLLYTLRWVGGAMMTLASARWLTAAMKALLLETPAAQATVMSTTSTLAKAA